MARSARGADLEVSVRFDGSRERRPFERSRQDGLHAWSGSDRKLIEEAAERLGTDPDVVARTGALAYAKRVIANAKGMAKLRAGERSGYVGARDADLARALASLTASGKPVTPARLATRAGVGFTTAAGWLLRVRPDLAE